MTRKIPSADQMFDILSSMNAGKFATVCYLNVVKLRKTKKGLDLDAFGNDLESNRTENDSFWYDPLKKFQQDSNVKKNPIYAIISLTTYNLNWSTEESYNKNLHDYMSKKDEIDKRYGIYKDPSERREGGFSKTNDMGINLGTTDNTRNRAYMHQNTYGAKKKTAYYVIDTNGSIMGEIPYNAFRSLVTKSSNSGVNALKKLNASDETIQEYLKEIDNLKFSQRKFLVDQILYIVATVNGEKIFFINNVMPSEIKETNVNSQEFINIIKNKFAETFAEISEQCRRFKKTLFENKIRFAIRDSIRELLK